MDSNRRHRLASGHYWRWSSVLLVVVGGLGLVRAGDEARDASLVVGGVLLLLALRMAVVGVFDDGSSLVIRNVFSTRRVAWSDVRGASVRQVWYSRTRFNILCLATGQGRDVGLSATATMSSRLAIGIVADLCAAATPHQVAIDVPPDSLASGWFT